MSAKVSVVIPVYNVEKFLRECLDSVVNQTLRDLQVICVNDGSPDHSQQILEEYAAKDSRIMIIKKENGGLSSARNAAYPHLKGRYTLFVDSDDWIDPALCEKTYAVAEKENADVTLFFYQPTTVTRRKKRGGSILEDFMKSHAFSEADELLRIKHVTAWSKLWKTSFLTNHQIFFPPGICYEDTVVQWKAAIQNPKYAVLPERLYFYRENPGSIMKNKAGGASKDIVPCFDLIKEMLLDHGKYHDKWKNDFLEHKLDMFMHCYSFWTHPGHKNELLSAVKKSIGDDEKEFLRQNHTGKSGLYLSFYQSLDGSLVPRLKYNFYLTLKKTKMFVSRLLRKLIP